MKILEFFPSYTGNETTYWIIGLIVVGVIVFFYIRYMEGHMSYKDEVVSEQEYERERTSEKGRVSQQVEQMLIMLPEL